MTSPSVAKLDDNGRSVLGRVFAILECFTDDQAEQTISDLCDQTGLPPATVHRILASLITWEAVERTSRGCYRLGQRMWRIGAAVPTVSKWRSVARPALIDLHKETGAMTCLAQREGDVMILIDVFGGRREVSTWEPRRPMGLPNCASGRVLLAFGDPSYAETIMHRMPADRALELRQRLAGIRRAGFAVFVNGSETWLASPVFDADGQVTVALTLRIEGQVSDCSGFGLRLVEAARSVSRDLGWRGDRRRPSLAAEHGLRKSA